MMYKRLMLHCFGSLSNFGISELNFVIILNSFPIIIIILNSHYNNLIKINTYYHKDYRQYVIRIWYIVTTSNN